MGKALDETLGGVPLWFGSVKSRRFALLVRGRAASTQLTPLEPASVNLREGRLGRWADEATGRNSSRAPERPAQSKALEGVVGLQVCEAHIHSLALIARFQERLGLHLRRATSRATRAHSLPSSSRCASTGIGFLPDAASSITWYRFDRILREELFVTLFLQAHRKRCSRPTSTAGQGCFG